MLGIMHSDREDGPAFVFDMIEPERPEGGPGGTCISQVRGVASGGLHDSRRRGGEARSGVGEEGGAYIKLEPERRKGWTGCVIAFAARGIASADFTMRANGVVRLNPELARRVVREIPAKNPTPLKGDRFLAY